MTGAGPPRIDWGLGRYEHTAAQTELVDHPVSSASRAMLEARGKADVGVTIVERAREILDAANEAADAFAVTSSYVVARASARP